MKVFVGIDLQLVVIGISLLAEFLMAFWLKKKEGNETYESAICQLYL